MESSSSPKVEPDADDDVSEEVFEHFDDFTIASSWERFISKIEAICRLWMADGPNNLLEKGAIPLENSKNSYKIKSELQYDVKSYCMEYYFETKTGKSFDWNSTFHDLQLCFGVKEFLLIAPQSASGVVLDAPEASKLLSAVAIALSNSSSLWPAFVPVHDPSRKAYIGIQNTGTAFTRRFEADRIGSQVPPSLMHLEGLYQLFVSKFAYCTDDLDKHLIKVQFAMKLTYRTLPYDDDNIKDIDVQNTKSGKNLAGESSNERLWDDDCSWSEWYSSEDPVKGFELIAIWSEKTIESSMEMEEVENASPHEAEKWFISPSFAPYLLEYSNGNQFGFASALHLLVDAFEMSFEAQFLEDFVSAAESPGPDNLKSSMVIPPPTVRDRVLKELFDEGVQLIDSAYDEHKTPQAIKGAPLETLFAQFCLHSLWVGNCHIRAIAALWIEFVQEVRWCWEESQLLPRMPVNGSIDLSTCLINQKLHMLAVCIKKKREWNEDHRECMGSEDQIDYMTEEESAVGDDTSSMQAQNEDFSGKFTGEPRSFPTSRDLHYSDTAFTVSQDPVKDDLLNGEKSSDQTRRGSAGVIDSMMLLKSYQRMHAPYTQEAPLMTEDMYEERLQALEASNGSFNYFAQLERDILTSDMAAFKAANPDAIFEDFIRWHSPADWLEDPEVEKSKDNWPPRGHLSKRMSESDNLWRELWDRAHALAASEQKPLFDPNREGEKVIHYLETLRPHQLLAQMVCTAFLAAADTVNKTSYGELKQMETKMQQLYLTMAPALKPLEANRLSADSETIEDLKRQCVVFGHVENLLTVAASLHRKLVQAPRLAVEIFIDFYNFYIPRMGTGLEEDYSNKKEFDKKQIVWNNEREVVSSMFVPPTANQSWRKVFSMGNLLNGHEPMVREIIFSLHDGVSNNHYAAPNASVSEQEIDTYRMYICGTSNDLRVSLSVVSCD
ncbi:uncharacterized protein LOC107458326 isoform X1 [Arachis duranensis]|uniref:Rab3 GTPase-activating protein catalytic subunit n=1 Tax=Arachis duranensis TaxID=130453 RepID=A0A6P4AWG2_ARADU|nr:uncharacterized protein LOC107458326 isoform X1 [Arachis duranensis]XP_052107703.1 uncharacterized protein LOC107458326 isoform X1 [Arachis duranensis]XP_052107704.1 uncharacterized protein LOC107458326 isoform X1 [Arachis duranensis]